MKVTTIPKEEEFSKFDLVITVESLKEAAALFSLFNYSDITNTMDEFGIGSDCIKSAINKNIPSSMVDSRWYGEPFDNLFKVLERNK